MRDFLTAVLGALEVMSGWFSAEPRTPTRVGGWRQVVAVILLGLLAVACIGLIWSLA
jgi:hypothetical protein